jgi:hypothetical protein
MFRYPSEGPRAPWNLQEGRGNWGSAAGGANLRARQVIIPGLQDRRLPQRIVVSRLHGHTRRSLGKAGCGAATHFHRVAASTWLRDPLNSRICRGTAKTFSDSPFSLTFARGSFWGSLHAAESLTETLYVLSKDGDLMFQLCHFAATAHGVYQRECATHLSRDLLRRIILLQQESNSINFFHGTHRLHKRTTS